jgi:GNAT superfamily N-acetyltransferase
MAGAVPTLEIRRASPADVQRAMPVVNAAYAIEDFLDGTRIDEQRMAEMLKKGELLVGVADGRVIACVYVEQRGERGYFGMLSVDPAQQGKGVGRQMIAAAEDHCRRWGCKHIDIMVLALRTELPPFYGKLGYREIRREDFRPTRPLKNGATHTVGIVMSKTL